jgi:hypothetical protein
MPDLAPADGESPVVIAVWVQDERGRPRSGANVTLAGDPAAQLRQPVARTDKQGRALAALTAEQAHDAAIQISVDGVPLGERVPVRFLPPVVDGVHLSAGETTLLAQAPAYTATFSKRGCLVALRIPGRAGTLLDPLNCYSINFAGGWKLKMPSGWAYANEDQEPAEISGSVDGLRFAWERLRTAGGTWAPVRLTSRYRFTADRMEHSAVVETTGTPVLQFAYAQDSLEIPLSSRAAWPGWGRGRDESLRTLLGLGLLDRKSPEWADQFPPILALYNARVGLGLGLLNTDSLPSVWDFGSNGATFGFALRLMDPGDATSHTGSLAMARFIVTPNRGDTFREGLRGYRNAYYAEYFPDGKYASHVHPAAKGVPVWLTQGFVWNTLQATFPQVRQKVDALPAAFAGATVMWYLGFQEPGHERLYPDYYPISAAAGGGAAFSDLIAATKRRGMRVMLYTNAGFASPRSQNWRPEWDSGISHPLAYDRNLARQVDRLIPSWRGYFSSLAARFQADFAPDLLQLDQLPLLVHGVSYPRDSLGLYRGDNWKRNRWFDLGVQSMLEQLHAATPAGLMMEGYQPVVHRRMDVVQAGRLTPDADPPSWVIPRYLDPETMCLFEGFSNRHSDTGNRRLLRMALVVGGYVYPGNDAPDGIGVYRSLSPTSRETLHQFIADWQRCYRVGAFPYGFVDEDGVAKSNSAIKLGLFVDRALSRAVIVAWNRADTPQTATLTVNLAAHGLPDATTVTDLRTGARLASLEALAFQPQEARLLAFSAGPLPAVEQTGSLQPVGQVGGVPSAARRSALPQ